MDIQERLCPRCNTRKSLDQFYRRRKDKHLSSYCKSCASDQCKERHIAIKKQCVTYKGGKCLSCGYPGTSLAAMEFHHLDRKTKNASISVIKTRSFEQLKPELDKCILLCCLCHREIEDGVRQCPQEDSNLQPTR